MNAAECRSHLFRREHVRYASIETVYINDDEQHVMITSTGHLLTTHERTEGIGKDYRCTNYKTSERRHRLDRGSDTEVRDASKLTAAR